MTKLLFQALCGITWGVFLISSGVSYGFLADDEETEEATDVKVSKVADEIAPRISEEKEKIHKLDEFLTEQDFPYRFLDVSVDLDRSKVRIANGKAHMRVSLELSVNTTKFYKFIDGLRPQLESLAISDFSWTQRNPPHFPDEVDRFWIVDPPFPPRWERRYVYVGIPAIRAAKFEKIRWHVYALPRRSTAVLRYYSSILPTIELAFKDRLGDEVTKSYLSSFRPNSKFDFFARELRRPFHMPPPPPPPGKRHEPGRDAPRRPPFEPPFLANFCYDLFAPPEGGYWYLPEEELDAPESLCVFIEDESKISKYYFFLPVFFTPSEIFAGRADFILPSGFRKRAHIDAEVPLDYDDFEKIAKVESKVVDTNPTLKSIRENIDEKIEETVEFYDLD